MPSLISYFESPSEQPLQSLKELRLGREPALLQVFTDEVEPAVLHFEEDEQWRKYVVCPGEGCALCYLGNAPGQSLLLPVINLASRQVEVLRIPPSRGPDSLGILLCPFLKDPNISDKGLRISSANYRYHIEAFPLADAIDYGSGAVAGFHAAHKGGLKLCTAFPRPTPAQIAEIPRIQRKLQPLGGIRVITKTAESK